MFRGRHEHTIDAKGRTSVPARYRDVLSATGERRLVLTPGLDPYLMAYTLAEWIAFEERLSALPQFDRLVQQMKRICISGAVECDIDEVGRILVPPTLRAHADLKKDVLWAGAGRYAELWDMGAWRRQIEISEEEKVAMSTRLTELKL
jgi:MraZ protein